MAKPFLRWVGGKGKLLPEIRKHLPTRYNRYFEPFVGAGALFFDLQPKAAFLSDANSRLISTYRAIRDYPENVIGLLDDMTTRHSKEFYAWVRSQPPDHFSDAGIAAWMIYLNKTDFNGLYRVNKTGGFNVPMDPSRPAKSICDRETIHAASAALQAVEIHHIDFRHAVETCTEGDLVYFDPPYVPMTATSNFTSYTTEGFTDVDQHQLRDLALQLKRRGVHVLLSNSGAEAVRALYRDGFEITTIDRQGTVSSKATGRGRVEEVIIR